MARPGPVWRACSCPVDGGPDRPDPPTPRLPPPLPQRRLLVHPLFHRSVSRWERLPLSIVLRLSAALGRVVEFLSGLLWTRRRPYQRAPGRLFESVAVPSAVSRVTRGHEVVVVGQQDATGIVEADPSG